MSGTADHLAPSAPKPARRDQLVATAVELFSSSGYRETSLQEITSKLEITRPLFYYYFESKEDLLWHIVGRLGDHMLENARPIAAAPTSPREKLPRLIEAHTTALLTNLDVFRIYFAERHLLQGARDRQLKRGERAYQKLIAGVIEEGQELGEFRGGDSQVLTRFLTGMANSVTRWYAESGHLGVEEISRLAGELAVASLRPGAHRPSRSTPTAPRGRAGRRAQRP